MIVDAWLNSINVSLEVPSDEDGFIREDIIGMRVYVSESPITSGSPTTLKYDGGSLSTTIVGLKGGQQYYVAAAYMSAFCGNDFPDSELTLVSVVQVTTLKAPGAISVQVERPSVLLIADSSGVVSSYSDSGTTIKVFDGPTELQYDGTGTSNGTWKVVASGTSITVGSLTDSGSFVTVGQHSAMNQDTAKVAYAISGVTSLGSSFSQTVYQALSKVRKGVRGWTIATIGEWSDASAAAAIAAIVTANGSSPTTLIKGDTVFYSGGAKQYNGSSWDTAANFIHGNLLVDGTIIGKNLAAEFSIQSNGKIIAGSSDSGVVLSSDGTVKVLQYGLTRAVMGKIGSSYGFQAYSPSGLKLFDSLAETAFIANIGKNNYLIGDYTTFPSYNDSGAGNYNIAIGGNTLTGAANAGRLYNVAIGHLALATGQGSYNVAIGDASQSAFDGASQNTGNYNTSVGVHSLFSLQSGNNITAIGYNAGWSVTSGTPHLTLVGADSGSWLTGGYSTCIGSSAGTSAASYVTTVGYNAGSNAGHYSVSVGENSNSSYYGISIGSYAITSASYAIAIGALARGGVRSISIGRLAGSSIDNGTDNVIIGEVSGKSLTTGSASAFYGVGAGEFSVESFGCSMYGFRSGRYATGSYNTLLGYATGHDYTGDGSVYVGYRSGYTSTGNNAVAVGRQSETTGDSSIALGCYSKAALNSVNIGAYCDGVSTNSVMIGYGAGTNITSGSANVLVGYMSGNSLPADTSDVVILGGATTATTGSITLSTGEGVVRATCDSSGNWLASGSIKSSSALGVSSGGSITQATSRTTGVTLNKPSGEITLFSTTTTAGQVSTFTVTNSFVTATGTIIVNQKTGSGVYLCSVTGVSAGSFKVSVYTPAAVTTAESPKLSFVVISGATV